MEQNKQLSDQIQERYISYYTRKFTSDLESYYDIDSCDGSYPFVIKCACDEQLNINTKRLSMKWVDLKHFYMFSVSVFFTSLCEQIIGKLYGVVQMENFMRAKGWKFEKVKGWPMLNCGMGGLMHPIIVISDSNLDPKEDKDGYLDILHAASKYLKSDFLDFFSGHAANLNSYAYRQLCDVVISQEIDKEFQVQMSLYEAWTHNPNVRFHFNYVKYPRGTKIGISSFLSQFEEEMPIWLEEYKEGEALSFSDIMFGRIAYYPGSGYDGTLIKVVNKSHSVHSYLYVDYGIEKEEMINHLAKRNSIYGYHSIGRIEWNEKDILPNGQHPLNVEKKPRTQYNGPLKADEKPYCFTEILERDSDKNEEFGARRFAITFLFRDGIDTYYQLFCMEYKKAPWIFLLQDHKFGGNYDKFGKGGLLDAIITENEISPKFVICSNKKNIWEGYKEVTGLPSIIGSKSLYQKMPGRNRHGDIASVI